MSGREGRKKRSSSPRKSRCEKVRKPKQASTKRRDTKNNDCSDHKDTKVLDDGGLGASSMRTNSFDDTWHAGGRKVPPFNGFFNLSANTGPRQTYARNTSKETDEDPFAYIRGKLKNQKHKKKDKVPNKNQGGKNDSSGSGSDSNGESESSTDSESSEDCESNRDSKGDDSEYSVCSKNTKHRSRIEGASGGTKAGKRNETELPRELSRLSLTPEKYEWQFFDERWITYGQANFAGAQPSETEYKSDDIEAFYRTRYPEQRYMLIQNKYHTYKLDFKEMTQTNQSTSVERQIRRIPKQAANSSLELRDYSGPGSSYMHHVFGRGDRGDDPHGHGTTHTRLLWQFKDESGAWITYGQSSPKGVQGSGTTTASDDINKFRLRNPDDRMMAIQSNLHKYVLDFEKMTQTNIKTSAERKIRSLPFADSNASFPAGASSQAIGRHNSGGTFGDYVWQFQDDNGAWITYGKASLALETPFATTVTSDDIEQFYNVKRGMEPMKISYSHFQYLLDFRTLTQTNLITGNRRNIRRIPKH